MTANSGCEAAARELFSLGRQHHWWPESVDSFDALDPIGKDEFLTIVESVLSAAAAGRAELDKLPVGR